MAPIHADLPVVEFATEGNIVQRQYCLQSGKTTNTFCTQRASGWFKMSNIPPLCDGHNIAGDGIYLLDENGNPILDEKGDPILADSSEAEEITGGSNQSNDGGNVGETPPNGEYDPSDPLSYWRWLYGVDQPEGEAAD